MKNKFKAALCQLDLKDDCDYNRKVILEALVKAKELGTDLACLPETSNFTPFSRKELKGESLKGETISLLTEFAVKNNMDIHIGSMLEKDEEKSNIYNTSLYITNSGDVKGIYHKIHMFDATLRSGKTVKESDLYTPGDRMVIYSTRFGIFGNAICYDVRFPELYRKLTLAGAKVIFNPSNFSSDTGERHWEVLLRARAVENNVFIIAANQYGEKKNYTSYGNSMAIDPDGKILGKLDRDKGILTVDIDLSKVGECRNNIPNLLHRRDDIYLKDVEKEV